MAKYHYYRDASGMVYRFNAGTMQEPGVTAFLTRDREWLPPTVGAKLYANQYARELRDQITPASSIYAIQRYRSRSGETRTYDIFIISCLTPVRINHAISAVTGIPLNKKGYLSIRGYGFSGEVHIADCLSHELWPFNKENLTVRIM